MQLVTLPGNDLVSSLKTYIIQMTVTLTVRYVKTQQRVTLLYILHIHTIGPALEQNSYLSNPFIKERIKMAKTQFHICEDSFIPFVKIKNGDFTAFPQPEQG